MIIFKHDSSASSFIVAAVVDMSCHSFTSHSSATVVSITHISTPANSKLHTFFLPDSENKQFPQELELTGVIGFNGKCVASFCNLFFGIGI